MDPANRGHPSSRSVTSSISTSFSSSSSGSASSRRVREELDRTLGTGSFGHVYRLRDRETKARTHRIVKINPLWRIGQHINFAREVLYLDLLRPIEWFDGTQWAPLVPKLWSRRVHGDEKDATGIQTMEELDGTFHDLGLRQAELHRHRHPDRNPDDLEVVYTWKQLNSYRHLVRALDEHGLVHGDLKRKNVLCHALSSTLRICDLGFTGFVHTMSKPSSSTDRLLQPQLGFPALPTRPRDPLASALWPYVNRWQAYYDFIYNRPTHWYRRTTGDLELLRPDQVRRLFALPVPIRDEFMRLYGLFPTNPKLPASIRCRCSPLQWTKAAQTASVRFL